jgi:hypothetical protein
MRPVSYTEIKTFSTCRQKWHYSYVENLVSNVLEPLPTGGQWAHTALETFYSGGDWRSALAECLAQALKTQIRKDEDIELLIELHATVEEVIERYLKYYQSDEMVPLAVELPFELPTPCGIPVSGRIDAIMKDRHDQLWLFDHKFPKSSFADYDQLQLNGQIGIYEWACHQLGYPVKGTIINQSLMRRMARPKRNKDGSMSRVKIACEWETYRWALIDAGLEVTDYLDMMEKLEEVRFVQRTKIIRSPREINLFAEDLFKRLRALREEEKLIFRNEDRTHCMMCSYRELCLLELKGGDSQWLRDMRYRQRGKRPEPVQIKMEEEDWLTF